LRCALVFDSGDEKGRMKIAKSKSKIASQRLSMRIKAPEDARLNIEKEDSVGSVMEIEKGEKCCGRSSLGLPQGRALTSRPADSRRKAHK
jgi:hypothetical protein